jgi:short chain dehydrogenase
MIAINVQGLLYTTRAALPHLLQAAEQGPRRVADIVNISSIAGRVAWNGYGVYSFTKFGVNGFTESLRQEVTQRHVRVGLVEPGGVATELGSHNKPEIRNEMIDPFYEQTEVLAPKTSPTASPTWSPAPATPPSASCGSCPPTRSDRNRFPAKTSRGPPAPRAGTVRAHNTRMRSTGQQASDLEHAHGAGAARKNIRSRASWTTIQSAARTCISAARGLLEVPSRSATNYRAAGISDG